jgi:serine/threonine protein kinase/Tol biopolymer transport system component
MPIPNGTRFGPYEIAGWLGAGGMGEVYRARDVRLQRQVAIKVVPERLVADVTHLDRFRQEARAAGQLNHPNITTVYDSGVHAGMPYIVSELLEGESLGSRLDAGPLPVEKAIEYASQIAEGLAAAHDRSILHRDLKPDNLYVTADGRIKILDFGIAKLLQSNDEGATTPRRETEPGMILGTVSYMSPEQVRGEPLDARSDIFSVGIILREMLTGHPPFHRGTTADTMAAILKEEPSGELPATVSPALERIVARCLEKSREARFQSARDLAFGLQFLSGTGTALPAHQNTRRLKSLDRFLPWTIAGAVSVALAVSVLSWAPWTPAPSREPLRLIANLGGDAPLAPLNVQYGNAVELSPDGSTIAFVARASAETLPLLYVRRLNQTHATALAGTEDAISPFFSPDSQWIGFFADMKLKKIAATGGAPIVVADALSGRGGTWAPDGTIVFQADNQPKRPLSRVSANGGQAVALAALAEGEITEVWPQVLPSGRTLIYTSSVVAGAYNDANVMGRLLPDGPPKVIVRGGYHGRALPGGQLIYIHDNTLFAAPFDPVRLEVTAPAVPALEGVMSNGITGGAQFSVSNDGTLVYLPGLSEGGTRLQWMDRTGKTTTLRGTVANWFTPAFSPDGARVAMEITERTAQGDIWVYEPARDAMTRLTTNVARDTRPVWAPDGLRVAFASDQAAPGTPNLYAAPADGSREAERLTTSSNAQQPGSWHPSGKFLAFEEMNPVTRMDVMILPIERDEQARWKVGPATAFVNTTQMEWDPAFSPDGRWIAYASSTSPADRDVFVQPFPGPGPKVQVSMGGGESPVWSRTKRELLYGADGQIMAVSYTTDGGSFRPSAPRVWSPGRYQTRGRVLMFDLHPDGERVALAPASEAPNSGKQDQAVFVFNFFDELKRLTRSSTR